MKLKTTVVAIVACLMLAIPGAAFAQSPTADAYSGTAGQQVGGDSGSGPNVDAANTSGSNSNTSPSATVEAVSAEPAPLAVSEESSPAGGGTLPFTGLEVGLIALVGAGLLGGGFALYRFSRVSRTAA